MKFRVFSKPGITVLKLYEQDTDIKFLNNKYDVSVKNWDQL